ncbi:helix-turn-helix transcriptional regulator [Parvibaculum sp.]|uniref:helix-turn-helix domain-containing protein n=1 Tax=Parvibaculum sp. TaxID=2024848 RepID=UPI002C566735|nr:helix-turn-helix transcriptional regulator [Parvibaculum sp.]HUD52606.1 helix-turn-helix transcriptional regulator [Parvibaculum sp.]
MSDPDSINRSGGKDHQRLMGPDGQPLFVLVPVAEYETLTNLGDAAGEMSRAHAILAERLGGAPAGVAHRIAEGENPVRVWREFRGLKAVALARAAGISPAYLSEIETGKKDGTFRTMASIARVLGVSLDDLAPAADEAGKRLRERNALIDGVRAHVRTLVTLVTGPVDFNTAAVRRTVTSLAADAVALKAQDCNPDGWLDGVLAGVRDVLDLVDKAEGDIIATAQKAQHALEHIVKQPAFQPPDHAGDLQPASSAVTAAE